MDVAVEALLLVLAAAMFATSAIAVPALRRSLQTLVAALAVLGAVLADWTLADTLMVWALLAILAAVSTSYATEFRRSGQAESEARRAAERRTELLEAVRTLPELDLHGAAQVTTAALRAFGAIASGVVVVRDGRIVPIDLNGVPPIERLLRVGEGVSGRAVAEGRTLVFEDYQELPERFDHLQELRSTISTPIKVGDEVVGAIMAAQTHSGRPTEGQIEVAEVLAAHLGAMLATRRQLENRRNLLERMDRLEAMRSAFVEEVSDELRDPLTIIRGAGHTMRRHSEDLRDEDRQRLLERLCAQADELRAVVDALLDFSRVQASQRDPELELVSIRQLLGTFGARVSLRGTPPLDVQVEVDVTLTRHAVDLLLGERIADIDITIADRSVEIAFRDAGSDRPALVRSLAEQLVVEAGGTLRFEAVPTLRLPRPAHAGEAAT